MLLMAATAGVFAWVVTAGERPAADYHPVTATAYRARPWLFAIAALVLIAVNLKPLGALPYVSRPGLGASQRVAVTAEQWSWTITPATVTVGRPVEFHIASKDVNHGFAIYDQGLRLVAQT
jgi:cytochrome c oxidase subunit 2